MKKNSLKPNISLKNKRTKIGILSSICGVMAIASIFMTIETAASGQEVSNIQNKQAQLLKEQQELQEKLVENLSINSLEEKSSELGFVKVNNLVYVVSSEFVAGANEGVPVAASLR